MPFAKLPLKKRILLLHTDEASKKKGESQQAKAKKALKVAREVGAAQRKKLAENRKGLTRLERELLSFNPAPGNAF